MCVFVSVSIIERASSQQGSFTFNMYTYQYIYIYIYTFACIYRGSSNVGGVLYPHHLW